MDLKKKHSNTLIRCVCKLNKWIGSYKTEMFLENMIWILAMHEQNWSFWRNDLYSKPFSIEEIACFLLKNIK